MLQCIKREREKEDSMFPEVKTNHFADNISSSEKRSRDELKDNMYKT